MKRLLLLALTAFSILGCARHVVVAPEAVSSLNSPDWTIKSTPAAKAPGTKQ